MDLQDAVSDLVNTIGILKALLLQYGDEYAMQSDEMIILNIHARPGTTAYLFAAIEDYATQAEKQAAALEALIP